MQEQDHTNQPTTPPKPQQQRDSKEQGNQSKNKGTGCKKTATPKTDHPKIYKGYPQLCVDVELFGIIFNIFWLCWKKYFVYLVKLSLCTRT
jgi:hypothetical protein